MLYINVSFHEGMKDFLRSGSEQSEAFIVSNGTKKGYVLAQYSLMLFFKKYSLTSEAANVEFRTCSYVHMRIFN